MGEAAAPSLEQLERELRFYRDEYNALGARMLRVQERLSQVTREARRSKIVARMVREAYAIGDSDLAEEEVGKPILSIVADSAICDQAVILRQDAESPGLFNVQHVVGGKVEGSLFIPNPPGFLFTASDQTGNPINKVLAELMGVPFLLWAHNPETGNAIMLGKRIEGNIHRPFEAGDREIVEVALAVYEDVCFRKRADATLLKAKQVAEASSEARARFLANLSHELRTPLNAIIGFAKLLTQIGADDRPVEESQEFAHLILDAGQGLSSLARDILDFSALSHSKPQLRPDWVPIAYLLHNAERAVLAQAAETGVRLTMIPPEKGLEAMLDYDRFRQILGNLLENAFKFTPRGGSITMSATRSGKNGLRLMVRDTGVGISKEDLPRVLEPFVQLDENIARGAGLGLPIALQLVEAHRGKLRIESAVGEGTSVIIALPPGSVRLAEQVSV